MEHRHLTLMFTDIVGYSRLMGQNESQTIELLGEYRRILLAQIERHCGTVIEFIGDAVFARFDSPDQAVQAGVDIQKDLVAFNDSQREGSDRKLPRLQSRIGIHMGEVALKDDALFGDDVNIAARLEPIAVADGLCISEDVYRAVQDNLNEPVLSLGHQPLKNIKNKIRAYLVRPAGITLRTHAHYLLRKFHQKTNEYRYPLAATLLMIVAAGFYFIPRWLVPGYTANYVEIADFKNLMSDDGSADYFSSGITEALRSQLADIRNIYILAADKGVRGPVRLEGSVQKVADRLRIAYQLFRRKDNVQIAGGKIDGAYADIFILQDQVVAEIAGYLAEEFNLESIRPAPPRLTSDITAYDYYLQGLEYLKKPKSHNNFDAAIKLMSTALVHDSSFALANAGMCSAYRGKYILTRAASWASKAEIYCQQALQLDDSLSEVYESLGVIYRDTGREEQAIEILKRAIEIDSTSVNATLALANVYQLQDKLDIAEKMIQDVITENPEYWVAHYELATFYMQTGRIKEAVETYKKVLDITPENAVAYSNLGGAYVYLAEYRKAAKAFDSSVSLSPSSWGYSNTGTMYYFAGDFQRSADLFREAVRLSPEDFRWCVNLADALRQLPGKTAEANNYYQKAINLALKGLEVNDKDTQLHQYLAISYLHLGDFDKAEEYLNNALRLNPEDVEVLYAKVRFWSTMKNTDKALAALEDLIKTGYSQDLLAADPDLKFLRDQPNYQGVFIADKGH